MKSQGHPYASNGSSIGHSALSTEMGIKATATVVMRLHTISLISTRLPKVMISARDRLARSFAFMFANAESRESWLRSSWA